MFIEQLLYFPRAKCKFGCRFSFKHAARSSTLHVVVWMHFLFTWPIQRSFHSLALDSCARRPNGRWINYQHDCKLLPLYDLFRWFNGEMKKKTHTTRIYAKHSKGERAGNKNKLTNEATKFVNFISNQNATIPFICKMIIKKNVRCNLSFTQKPWQLYTSVWLLFRWSLKSRLHA